MTIRISMPAWKTSSSATNSTWRSCAAFSPAWRSARVKRSRAEPPPELGLFEGYGIEIEYMIVDAGTLAVLPVTDQVLKALAGAFVNEAEAGALCWSNELALHVIELKTNGPAPSLDGLGARFQGDVERINGLLQGLGGRLMPTA